MTEMLTMLAQAASQPAAPTPKPPTGDFFWAQLLPLMLMIGVFYFIMMRGGRRERQRHEEMLKGIKRNDRVQTIGGILGAVVDVRDNEIVVKVDEATNTKMRFARGAIKEVLSDAPADGKA